MKIFNKILDASVFFSFDSSGYKRHKKSFNKDDLEFSMKNKVCLVTGSSSGIGFEVAKGLSKRGAITYLLCRNKIKGNLAVERIVSYTGNKSTFLCEIDLSNFSSIKSFCESFSQKKIDVLVHNAGLIPSSRFVNEEGVELSLATHVIGPHLLTKALYSKFTSSRIIWVSSGGMYLKKFNFEELNNKKNIYNGVNSYALTKRAQIILSEMWQEKLNSTNSVTNSMHPGWVKTVGIKNSLPRFSKLMQSRLRAPSEGADTILYLAVNNSLGLIGSKFWFDRKMVNSHFFNYTKEKSRDRKKLWEYCESFT
ncbi:SDR family NAD(P)-dependent oxidoreductase [Alphaproteobacteria bacterium]|nr:SDR family NAD(P)-dependent oxidoreductase [Alphaproteobacteria bacterium]